MTAADVDRTAARAALLAHLAHLADNGRMAPCLRWPGAGWTSEDVEEQRLAASMCRRCPAVELCRTYGLAYPQEFGVYGAVTDHERRPRSGQPKTEPTEKVA